MAAQYQKYDRTDTASVLEDTSKMGIDCIVTIPHQIIQGRMEEANRISLEAIKTFSGKVYAYIAVVPTCGMDTVKRELEKYYLSVIKNSQMGKIKLS